MTNQTNPTLINLQGSDSISPLNANQQRLMHKNMRKSAMQSRQEFFIRHKGPIKKKSYHVGGK